MEASRGPEKVVLEFLRHLANPRTDEARQIMLGFLTEKVRGAGLAARWMEGATRASLGGEALSWRIEHWARRGADAYVDFRVVGDRGDSLAGTIWLERETTCQSGSWSIVGFYDEPAYSERYLVPGPPTPIILPEATKSIAEPPERSVTVWVDATGDYWAGDRRLATLDLMKGLPGWPRAGSGNSSTGRTRPDLTLALDRMAQWGPVQALLARARESADGFHWLGIAVRQPGIPRDIEPWRLVHFRLAAGDRAGRTVIVTLKFTSSVAGPGVLARVGDAGADVLLPPAQCLDDVRDPKLASAAYRSMAEMLVHQLRSAWRGIENDPLARVIIVVPETDLQRVHVGDVMFVVDASLEVGLTDVSLPGG